MEAHDEQLVRIRIRRHQLQRHGDGVLVRAIGRQTGGEGMGGFLEPVNRSG